MRMRDGGGALSDETRALDVVSCSGLASAISISVDWTRTSDLTSASVSFAVPDEATACIELPSSDTPCPSTLTALSAFTGDGIIPQVQLKPGIARPTILKSVSVRLFSSFLPPKLDDIVPSLDPKTGPLPPSGRLPRFEDICP